MNQTIGRKHCAKEFGTMLYLRTQCFRLQFDRTGYVNKWYGICNEIVIELSVCHGREMEFRANDMASRVLSHMLQTRYDAAMQHLDRCH
jgi:hypothetical protein